VRANLAGRYSLLQERNGKEVWGLTRGTYQFPQKLPVLGRVDEHLGGLQASSAVDIVL
jgi:hypothetical protein